MERAESEVTPAFIAFPLKEEDGAKADADAARAERMNAKVFMFWSDSNESKWIYWIMFTDGGCYRKASP